MAPPRAAEVSSGQSTPAEERKVRLIQFSTKRTTAAFVSEGHGAAGRTAKDFSPSPAAGRIAKPRKPSARRTPYCRTIKCPRAGKTSESWRIITSPGGNEWVLAFVRSRVLWPAMRSSAVSFAAPCRTKIRHSGTRTLMNNLIRRDLQTRTAAGLVLMIVGATTCASAAAGFLDRPDGTARFAGGISALLKGLYGSARKPCGANADGFGSSSVPLGCGSSSFEWASFWGFLSARVPGSGSPAWT